MSDRVGQVWLEYGSTYLVVGEPEDDGHGYLSCKMLELEVGRICGWGLRPPWEDDETLTRIL